MRWRQHYIRCRGTRGKWKLTHLKWLSILTQTRIEAVHGIDFPNLCIRAGSNFDDPDIALSAPCKLPEVLYFDWFYG
jgi:hypothetical protein